MESSVEAFDFAFERPSFRRGKQRGGAIGSRRRGGNHTCMGRCGMCSSSPSKSSRAHARNREENWSKKRCEMDLVVSGTRTLFERFDCSRGVVLSR